MKKPETERLLTLTTDWISLNSRKSLARQCWCFQPFCFVWRSKMKKTRWPTSLYSRAACLWKLLIIYFFLVVFITTSALEKSSWTWYFSSLFMVVFTNSLAGKAILPNQTLTWPSDEETVSRPRKQCPYRETVSLLRKQCPYRWNGVLLRKQCPSRRTVFIPRKHVPIGRSFVVFSGSLGCPLSVLLGSLGISLSVPWG